MNKIVNLLTIVAMSVIIIVVSVTFSTAPSSAKSVATFPAFPIGQSRSVGFSNQPHSLAGMTQRERLDQLRDWLLLTTVSDSGLPPSEISQITFDVPAIRQGYMRPVANFEYGEARSRYLGHGQVLALVPRVPVVQRTAYLAQIADQQRKNLGMIPDETLVFEYTIEPGSDTDKASAILTRLENVTTKDLFMEQSGYHQAKIETLDDLKQFMSKIDVVTYVENGEHITVGGRKILDRQYRGIRVEDIAAIWQSTTQISTDQQKGVGFSLDPTYDFDSLLQFYDTDMAPVLRRILAYSSDTLDSNGNPSPENIENTLNYVRNGIVGHDIKPFLNLVSMLAKESNPAYRQMESNLKLKFGSSNFSLAEVWVQLLDMNFGLQTARYDGNLAGTEVGMSLFYTDLLAKLWLFDFSSSSPQWEIRGFKPLSGIHVSNAFKKEFFAISGTRLWFGPQANGFQVADGGGQLLFGSNSTRVYAASSNPLAPGSESAPNAPNAAFIDWWDEHYDEIARFEPEYERLNEIMKWSLLIGWLDSRQLRNKFQFLSSVAVGHDKWFPDWVKDHPELRFKKWEEIGFFPRGILGTKTEAMPLLQSESLVQFGEHMSFYGGVSLADKSLFRSRIALSAETKVAQVVRRSNLDYGASRAGGEAISYEGTSYAFRTLNRENAIVTAIPKQGTKLRSSFGEVADRAFERSVQQQPTGLGFNTKFDNVDVGQLKVARTPNGFSVGWEGYDIDLGQSLARKLSVEGNPSRILLGDPNVESVLSIADRQGYLVKLRGSERWLDLSAETKTGTGTLPSWQSRVGGASSDAPIYELAWKRTEDIDLTLRQANNLTVEPVMEAGGRYQLRAQPTGKIAGGREIEIQNGNTVVRGRVDSETGAVHFDYNQLPKEIHRDPGQLQRLVEKAKITPEESRYVVKDGIERDLLFRRINQGETNKLVEEMVGDPAVFRTRLRREFTDGVAESDRLLSTGQFNEAAGQLDKLIDLYGSRPELLLRRGAARLSDKFPETSEAFNQAMATGKAGDPALFLKEVNERLQLNASFPKNLAVVDNGGDLALSARIESASGGTPVSALELERGSGLIYVQDSPGLNNLDWNVSIHNSLRQAISGDLGTVVKLPRGEIGKFKPTVFYTADNGASFHGAGQVPSGSGYRFPLTYVGPFNIDDDEDKKKRDEEIYLVLAKP